MFKYNIYIESEVIVLPLVIYAETRETAYKKAVKQFREIFKKEENYKSYYPQRSLLFWWIRILKKKG